MLFICVVFVSIRLTYCSFRFSVSSSFIVIAACSSLSSNFLKSKSGSRIEEGWDALFFIAVFCNWCVRVIIKISVIFVFLWSRVLSEYAFRTNVSILNASCLIVSFSILRISLHKTIWCCLFPSESNVFENSCVNLFQSDFIFIGKTENPFWAAPSSAVWIKAVRLCI